MLTIRRKQMRAFSAYMLARFEDDMVQYLSETYPEQTGVIAEDELRRTVREGIDKAASYGVADEFDVRRFLDFVFSYGPTFDTAPGTEWAGDILRKKELSGTDKMDLLQVAEISQLGGSDHA